MREFDIRPMGRRWTAEETASRHEELPGRLEMAYGKLCLDEEQRLGCWALFWSPSEPSGQ